MQDLLNLRFLMLGQNEIGALTPGMFMGLRNLSELDLPLNALTNLQANAFKPLIALKVLDLSLNRIQRVAPKAFTGLRQLLFLNLDNNRSALLIVWLMLKCVPVLVIFFLPSCQAVIVYTEFHMHLSNPSLKTVPAGVFKPLRSLEMLVLDNNLLTTLSPTVLDGLTNLKVNLCLLFLMFC